MALGLLLQFLQFPLNLCPLHLHSQSPGLVPDPLHRLPHPSQKPVGLCEFFQQLQLGTRLCPQLRASGSPDPLQGPFDLILLPGPFLRTGAPPLAEHRILSS